MTRHRASRAQRPMVDISPAATPESMPCCNSISTPTPAAESSTISRAAMTNIHATGFSSDVTLRPLPASACCTAFSGTRVIRATKPLSPVSVTSSCVAGSAGHNSLWLLWDVARKSLSPVISARNAGQRASSSAGVPVSTIRPLSSTTTRLAS